MQLNKFFSSSNFCLRKSFHSLFICAKEYDTPVMQSFFNNIDRYLENPKNIFFKNDAGDTTTVSVVNIENRLYVVKRYNFKNFWHALKLRFRSSRAMRSWLFTHHLHALGIKTIKPVAILEERWGLLRGRAYFISEYKQGIRGCDYFSDASLTKKNWPVAIRGILNLTLQLRESYLSHGDYHFGNLVMVNDEPVLLDLDRMWCYRSNNRRFQRAHKKDLDNFKRYLKRNNQADIAFANLSSEY
jgi:Lipopolysaccharide kinase (Kdo/WaaP) family